MTARRELPALEIEAPDCNLTAPPPVDGVETMMASDPSRQQIDLSQRISDVAPRIRRFLGRLGAQDPEDLLQDVMERALRYQNSFDASAGRLEHWLMKIAFRTYLDHRNRTARQPRALGDGDGELSLGRAAHPAEVRDQVGHALRQLSPIEQDLILRFHHQRESIADISVAMGMPAGTVKSHLHRARRKLAQLPTEDGGHQ